VINNYYYGTGRRKTAVAKVRLMQGKGDIVVNGRAFNEYFPMEMFREVCMSPLEITETIGQFNVFISVKGGGYSAQAGSVRHGLTRALIEFNPNLKPILKKAGFTTRDPRMVERQKYGQKGARARYQFSKR
jgi:small subunit ribosomal protein S9